MHEVTAFDKMIGVHRRQIAAICLLLAMAGCAGPSEITEAEVARVRDVIAERAAANPKGLPVSNNAMRIISAEASGKTLIVHGLIDLPETNDPKRRAQQHDPSFHRYVYVWIGDALCDLAAVRRIAQDSEGEVRLVVFEPNRTPWGQPLSIFCPRGNFKPDTEASLRDVLPMLVESPVGGSRSPAPAYRGRPSDDIDRTADAVARAADEAAGAIPARSQPDASPRPPISRPSTTVARPSAPSSGSLTFCVESNTPYVYNVAVAYRSRSTGETRSQGWWNIPHGQCRTVLRGAMTDSFHFRAAYGMQTRPTGSDFGDILAALTAADSIRVLGGDHIYCVSNSAFRVVGNRRCVSRGYQNGGFVHVDAPGTRDIVVELYERGSYRVTW